MRTSSTARRAKSALVTIALLSGCASQSASPPPVEPATSSAAIEPSSGVEVPPPAEVEVTDVTYGTGEPLLKGVLAHPAVAGKRPGVLVVHEWWGLNDYARMRARKLAEQGYVALAVDMYGDGKLASHPDDAKKFSSEVMSHMDEAGRRFEAARALLAADPRVDAGKIAAIGYCFGGGVVLNMARAGSPLAAVASFHGMLGAAAPMKPGAFAGRILVAAGGDDPFVPMDQVEAFKREMDAAGAHYEVVVYPGAKHSFTNPGATEAGAEFGLPLAYDAAADAASWQKLGELLHALWPDS